MTTKPTTKTRSIILRRRNNNNNGITIEMDRLKMEDGNEAEGQTGQYQNLGPWQFVAKFRRQECAYVTLGQVAPFEMCCNCGELGQHHSIQRPEPNCPANGPFLYPFTNAYGRIRFAHKLGRSKFVRLTTSFSDEINSSGVDDRVWEMLTKYGKLKQPELVLSIIGSVQVNVKSLSKKMKRIVFEEGIVNVIRDTNGWLINHGFDSGIGQLLGEAVHWGNSVQKRHRIHRRITCIGIAEWRRIERRDRLINNGKPLTIQFDGKSKEKMDDGENFRLHHSNSHFLLLDNGKRYSNVHTATIDFRSQFEHKITQITDTTTVMCVLFGGDLDCLEHVYRSLHHERNITHGIAVVVIEHSGGLADVIVCGQQNNHTMIGGLTIFIFCALMLIAVPSIVDALKRYSTIKLQNKIDPLRVATAKKCRHGNIYCTNTTTSFEKPYGIYGLLYLLSFIAYYAARLIAVITSVSTLITVIAVTVLYVLDDHGILDQPTGIVVFALAILVCIALVYGVFALKRFALIPYLVAMGVMISLIFVALIGYMLTIACTEYVDKQFRNEQLRQFYQEYSIDPDNEFVRFCVITLGALSLSSALLIHGYFWLIIFGCYRFLALRDAARLAHERGGLGYLKDSGMDDTKPFDEA